MPKRAIVLCLVLFVVCSGQSCDPLAAFLAAITRVAAGDPDPSLTFTWSPFAPDLSVQPGGTATQKITIEKKVDLNSQVHLRIEDLPSGWTATFDPPVIPETGTQSTLTITVPANAEIALYRLSLHVYEDSDPSRPGHFLTVRVVSGDAPEFILQVFPSVYSFERDLEVRVFEYSCGTLSTIPGTVTITLGGLTDDVVLVQPPTPAQVMIGGPGGTFVLQNAGIPRETPLDLELTLTGTGRDIVHTRTITLHIPD